MDFNRLNNNFEANSPAAADGANIPDLPPSLEIKPKREIWAYKPEHLIENQNGLNLLFKTFTMENETIRNLKGTDHEISDLNKIVG